MIDGVSEVPGGEIDEFGGLDGRVPVAGAVVSVPDQSLAGFGDDFVNRADGQPPGFGDVQRDHDHRRDCTESGPESRCGVVRFRM